MKTLYAYVKEKTKSSLTDAQGSTISDPVEMANLLYSTFKSIFTRESIGDRPTNDSAKPAKDSHDYYEKTEGENIRSVHGSCERFGWDQTHVFKRVEECPGTSPSNDCT